MGQADRGTTSPEADEYFARPSGDWARKKHRFLREFGPVALDATLGARRPKRSAVYIDLFAGPGLCVDRASGERFYGSPLTAVQMRSAGGLAFSEAHLVNTSDVQHAALEARLNVLERRGMLAIPRHRIFTHLGDANALVRPILDRVHPRAYAFVFADPARPNDLPFSTLEALRRYRDHESVDLYTLFPLGMALLRMLAYSEPARAVNSEAASRFFGDESWKRCEPLRITEQRRLEFARCLTDVYLARLRTLWTHAETVVSVRRKSSEMYKMCFASNHDAGKRISQWAVKLSEPEQPRLGDIF